MISFRDFKLQTPGVQWVLLVHMTSILWRNYLLARKIAGAGGEFNP